MILFVGQGGVGRLSCPVHCGMFRSIPDFYLTRRQEQPLKHHHQLWQPVLSPDIVRCSLGGKTVRDWEPLLRRSAKLNNLLLLAVQEPPSLPISDEAQRTVAPISISAHILVIQIFFFRGYKVISYSCINIDPVLAGFSEITPSSSRLDNVSINLSP